MQHISAITAITLAALLLLLAGCGGGHTALRPGGGQTTSAALTITWPERTRLLPLAAESIRVDVSGPHGFTATQTVDRPETGHTSVVPFFALPVGQLTFTATAYPQAGGQGVAQATASITQTAQANVPVTVTLTMASTIATVELSPANPTVGVNGTRQLTATAKNAAGEVVLVPTANAFTWTSSDTGITTVDGNGLVTGIAEGTATITATEKESGKSSTLAVTVTSQAEWKEKIVFSPLMYGGIFIVNPDGSGLRQLTEDSGSYDYDGGIGPALSSDGHHIAFIRRNWGESEFGIYLMNPDGSDVKCIYSTSEPIGAYLDWSPDSRKLAFSENYDIYIINSDGSGKQLVTSEGANPCWSPDGLEIAFVSNRVKENGYLDGNLSIVEVNGSNRRLITAFTEFGLVEKISWSPQNKIAFGPSNATGNIYLINPDGTGMQQFIAGWSPAFNPDGSSLAYIGDDEISLNYRNLGSTIIYPISNEYYFGSIDWGRIYVSPSWTGDITVQ